MFKKYLFLDETSIIKLISKKINLMQSKQKTVRPHYRAHKGQIEWLALA